MDNVQVTDATKISSPFKGSICLKKSLTAPTWAGEQTSTFLQPKYFLEKVDCSPTRIFEHRARAEVRLFKTYTVSYPLITKKTTSGLPKPKHPPT